jgi:hypothetical protein
VSTRRRDWRSAVGVGARRSRAYRHRRRMTSGLGATGCAPGKGAEDRDATSRPHL